MLLIIETINPLEQGLKHCSSTSAIFFSSVIETINPLEQGLKHVSNTSTWFRLLDWNY